MLNLNRLAHRTDASVSDEHSATQPLRAELVGRCVDLAGFLRGFGENEWSGWLEQRAADIAALRSESLESLLAGYLGVAGLCDLHLCPEAGHRLDAGDEAVVNEQVLTMLGGVNATARALQDASEGG